MNLERKVPDPDWRVREFYRLADRLNGANLPAWTDEPWFREAGHLYPDHWTYYYPDRPALLYYTQTPEKGALDIQTPIKPGRYLTRYFGPEAEGPARGTLTAKQIAYYAAWQTSGVRPAEPSADASRYILRFANDADTIADVYANGPYSCMRENPNDCLATYAAGDLAIAYLDDTRWDDSSSHPRYPARAICWPERRIYGRIYPTPGNSNDYAGSAIELDVFRGRLADALRAAGYSDVAAGGTFNGARLRRIEADWSDDETPVYLMPYIDGRWGVSASSDDSYWVLSDSPDYEADGTVGTLEIELEYPYTCERCGEGCHETTPVPAGLLSRNRLDYADWCSSCAEARAFYCEGFNADMSDTHFTRNRIPGEGTYSEEFLIQSDDFFQSDLSGDWFRGPAVDVDGESWSQDEADTGAFLCPIRDEHFPLDQRHPTHPEVHESCTPEEIAEHLATQGKEYAL